VGGRLHERAVLPPGGSCFVRCTGSWVGSGANLILCEEEKQNFYARPIIGFGFTLLHALFY